MRNKTRGHYLQLLLSLCIMGAGLLLAQVAHAEEPCLRGGTGNCVTLTSEGPAVGSGVLAGNMLSGSNSHNIVTLKDGTMIAAVAKFSSTSQNNGGLYPKQISRYKIVLYTSSDGGLTWSTPGIQGDWYVDQINNDGTGDPAGFLGFSLAVSERTTPAIHTDLFLVHTLACRGVDTDSPEICAFPTNTDSVHMNGTIKLEVIEFTQDKSLQIKASATISKRNTFMGSCNFSNPGGHICYAGVYGASHPNVWANDSEIFAYVSYSGYTGDTCSVTNPCKKQDETSISNPSVGAYVRKITYLDNIAAPNNLIINSVPVDELEFFNEAGGHIEKHSYFSAISAGVFLNTAYPIVLYGYSDPTSTALCPPNQYCRTLKWKFTSGAYPSWLGGSSIGSAVSLSNWHNGACPGSCELFAGVMDLSTNLPVPAFSLATSIKESNYYTSITDKMILHIAGLMNVAQSAADGNHWTGLPVYIKLGLTFTTYGAAPWWGPPINWPPENREGFLLADPSAGADLNKFNGDKKAYAENGGPTIGVGPQAAYIAFPAATVGASFTADKTDVYYTRIRSNITSSGSVYTYSWQTQLANATSLDLESSSATIPLFSRLTQQTASKERGVASPVIPQKIYSRLDYNNTQTVSNVFAPPMLFARKTTDSIIAQCSATNPCSVAFSGEPDTFGVRGWAWASTVGWISLSCENLQTCYRKAPPYSSTTDGSFYGVRAVVNNKLENKTLIGKAWSERVGYISFDRADSARPGNECGNPPDGATKASNTCALLSAAISDSDLMVSLTTTPTNTFAGFAPSGYVLIDREIIHYTLIGVAGQNATLALSAVSDRGWAPNTPAYAGSTYHSTARSHEVGTPVFFISSNDPTTTVPQPDLFLGTSIYNYSTFEITGWARATEWKKYQDTYCGANIGINFAPPCDKEWGWIKMTGTWQTSNRGTMTGSGPGYVKTTTVDGYPDATVAEPEFLRVGGVNNFYKYTSLDHTMRVFAMDPPANYPPFFADQEVVWVAKLKNDIAANATAIEVESINGLESAGKIEIVDNITDLAAATIEYARIDLASKTLSNFTPTQIPVGYAKADYHIRKKQEIGHYGTFAIPINDTVPEATLAGFAWSSPNTDTPTADPYASRYRDNVSGFGWINFQPNKLDLLYPYVRTLFSNIYAGGNINLAPPGSPLTPTQYTSTYLIQKTGSITPLINQGLAVAGARLRCEQSCGGDAACIQNCNDYLNESLSAPKVPQVSISDKQTGGLGKLPDYDALADMVSECQRWDFALAQYVDTACPGAGEGRKRSAFTTDPLLFPLYTNEAKTGNNKYGQRVILCRARPTLDPMDEIINTKSIFVDNGYNPPECTWMGAAGPVSFARVNPNAQQYFASRDQHTEPTVYVLPDDYGKGGKYLKMDEIDLQFDNGGTTTEGKPASGAVTFLIPGGLFLYNVQMRYCSNAPVGLECTDPQDDPTNANYLQITNIKQLASAGWVFKDTITTWLDPFSNFYPNGENKYYHVGAFSWTGGVLLPEDWSYFYGSSPGTFATSIDLSMNRESQYNLSGLVLAKNYFLPHEYIEQEQPSGAPNVPSENFVYDGRAVANPPPGFADLISGLPKIQKVTP